MSNEQMNQTVSEINRAETRPISTIGLDGEIVDQASTNPFEDDDLQSYMENHYPRMKTDERSSAFCLSQSS